MEENQNSSFSSRLSVLLTWYKTRSKTTKWIIWICIIAFIGNFLPDKHSSSSSYSSSSTGEHKCGYCNATFSGNGWSTVGGEQFEQTSWTGYGYCSKKCAYDSQPSRWKN